MLYGQRYSNPRLIDWLNIRTESHATCKMCSSVFKHTFTTIKTVSASEKGMRFSTLYYAKTVLYVMFTCYSRCYMRPDDDKWPTEDAPDWQHEMVYNLKNISGILSRTEWIASTTSQLHTIYVRCCVDRNQTSVWLLQQWMKLFPQLILKHFTLHT